MNINTSVNTPAQGAQGQGTDELMTKLSQILANRGASTASGAEVKNEDLALRESLSMAIQEQMGSPEAPEVGDELRASASLNAGLANGENFQVLMAKVLNVLIKSSAEQSASRREQRMTEAGQGLQNSLDAAGEMRGGATAAFITSMASSGVSLGMGIGGVGASVKAMKSNAAAADLKSQASKLTNPEMTGLATASNPKLADKPTDVAEAGGGSIDALKDTLLNQARQKDMQAQKATITADALGKIGGATGAAGAAAASAQVSHATAAQSEQEAFARRDQSEAEVALEWQNRMGGVREQILQVLQEVNRANTAAQASAFNNM
ncbi:MULTISPECIES: hypothetical protein [Candidatus Ichthyocystis]|uniref:Uncharacterized protein n=1 Tax=Candidatus Ichthyocystis hellenicum TaxID=1561003 RepID=A0A0S4M450_9BURK|nr:MULTISPECIES: hypothetical protein [Ichthyocystis]CUT17078.1 hypothetical protein Ark11_0221 [Candidatus Ichthyocystis hellenicum]